jgi:uncharacterized membrane protein YeaQ/YmgE (transglycosylase-associated protein family)
MSMEALTWPQALEWMRQAGSQPMLATTASWLAFGLTAGVCAKLILPGREGLGWIRTILLGMVGAILGGIGARYAFGLDLEWSWNTLTFACAVAGSLVLLILNRLVVKS